MNQTVATSSNYGWDEISIRMMQMHNWLIISVQSSPQWFMVKYGRWIKCSPSGLCSESAGQDFHQ